jgi:two-component system sensor histidine kinase GlrK
MKVRGKIISGFLVVMLLGIVVIINQLSTIRQLQNVNRGLSEINIKAATKVVELERLADLLDEDAKKYFVTLDPRYENQIADYRDDFIEDLVRLQATAVSAREQLQVAKLREALDDYWLAFNRLKQQNRARDLDELPPDLAIATNHLHKQSELMLEAVQKTINDRVATAADIGSAAYRLSWIAGGASFLVGIIVSALIVSSITEPLRRLTKGTRAIAKGQFWHRLPVQGSDEFAELARDFNAMTERLGELDEMKKDFVFHVSHDLKAPLASIRQIMHLLLQEIPGSLNEQQRSLIRLSYNSAERLASMVGNLLDVSRMEAGTMEYQMSEHDIIPLIRGVIDEFEVQAQDKGIQFRLECERPSVFVECDRDRIVQVIGNLYENALKFSPPQSQIVTHVGPGKGREILISVTDSGPGVPDDRKERIFHKFHQIKHGTKVAGQGVGLGLAICKTIVEAHRGQIWVEDNPNGGSKFSFVLHPAAREEVIACNQTA